MRGKGWVGLGLTVAAVALLMQIPASLLAQVISSNCAGLCRLAEAQGTVWNGEALVYLRPFSQAAWQEAGRLGWTAGTGGVRMQLDQGGLQLRPDKSGFFLDASSVVLPAALVLPLLPNAPRSGWEGQIEAAELHVHWSLGGIWEGNGTLRWLNAQTAMLPEVLLGDYRLQGLIDSGGGGKMQVLTERAAALALAGTGHADPGSNYAWEFSGMADILSSRTMLEPLMRTLGQPVAGGDGKYLLKGGRTF